MDEMFFLAAVPAVQIFLGFLLMTGARAHRLGGWSKLRFRHWVGIPLALIGMDVLTVVLWGASEVAHVHLF